jgi:hypothetical protein
MRKYRNTDPDGGQRGELAKIYQFCYPARASARAKRAFFVIIEFKKKSIVLPYLTDFWKILFFNDFATFVWGTVPGT